MSLEKVLVILSIVVAIVSLAGSIFMMGRVFGAMTAAIKAATDVFTNQIQNLAEDIKELKETNKELAQSLHYISTQQMVQVETNIARIDEGQKSAHQRLNSLECRIAREEDKR